MQLSVTEDLIDRMHGDVFNQRVISLARVKYYDYYHVEVELNATFNTFVLNYKAAYEGRNTRKDQIIHASRSLKITSDHERMFLELAKVASYVCMQFCDKAIASISLRMVRF